MTIPNFLKVKEPTIFDKIHDILSHPVTYFIYGCFYGSIGIIFWQTQVLTDYLISVNISPLLGIGITGICLILGFLWGYGNLDDFKKCITKINGDAL